MNFNGVTLTQINLHVHCLDAGSPRIQNAIRYHEVNIIIFLSNLGLQLLDSKTKLPHSRNPSDS